MTPVQKLRRLLSQPGPSAFLAAELIRARWVDADDQNELMELLYLHNRSHAGRVFTCPCGCECYDLVDHQIDALIDSGLLTQNPKEKP